MSTQIEEDVYKVGDYVEIGKNRKGIIRFEGVVGPVGQCFGIELDSVIDTGTDGTFDGERYFDCKDGKGTFIKASRIKQKLDISTRPKPKPKTPKTPKQPKEAQKEDDKKEKEAPKKGTDDDEEPKNGLIKVIQKKKKKKSKKNGSNNTSKKTSTKQTKSTTKSSKTTKAKKSKKSSKVNTSLSTENNDNSDDIPSDLSHIEKLQIIYPKLCNSKLPHTKRLKLIKTCSDTISDKAFGNESNNVKFAIDGFKKVFTEQLKDKKIGMQKELYSILKAFISSHFKAYKLKNTYFLKLCLNHIAKIKANDKKQLSEVDAMISFMINKIGMRDKKQLIIMLNEFIRNGSTSKNKNVKKKAWKFVHVALDKKQKANDGKIESNVLDSIEKTLKESLGNNDRIVQDGSFKILNLFYTSLNDTVRSEKLFKKLTASKQKQYFKLYPQSTPDWFKNGNKSSKKSSLKAPKPAKKRNVSIGTIEFGKVLNGKDLKRREDSLDEKRLKPIKEKTKKRNKKSIKTKAKTNVKTDKKKTTNNKKDSKKKGKKSSKKSVKNGKIKDKKATKKVDDDKKDGKKLKKKDKHQRSKKNLLSDDGGLSEMGDLSALIGTDSLLDALDIPLPGKETKEANDIEEEEEEETVTKGQSDEEVAEEDDDSDVDDFPLSFLLNDESRIDWQMVEYLQSDQAAATHKLLGVLSRIKWKLNVDKLEPIDYNECIPDTLPLFSEEEKEIDATQLSYNLMRILSTENGGNGTEAVSSYIMRMISEILLHSLAVYHLPLSSGNVYHGRVLLEILLNSWPKSLMMALVNNDLSNVIHFNVQTLFKNALFRALHQGNLNSFFLDLICYNPTNLSTYRSVLPFKKKIISLFQEWGFIEYLLETSASYKVGVNGDDDVATKYATFFIDLVARSAAIEEVAVLFEGCEHLIIDSFIKGILDKEGKRTRWHRMFCGQILIQFMDICSRPTIMDPTQLQIAQENGLEPEPSPNQLFPLFDECLKRLHSYIPQLTELVINYKSDFIEDGIRLSYTLIKEPFGQIRLHCLELLTISADFAQFECGNVLGKIPMKFWNYLLEMAFIHKNNNIFLCHFRRLIHLTMIFRRRILKHLFLEKKFLERFINFYVSEKIKSPLHGYVLQMIYDIWQHDQEVDEDEDDDEDDEDEEESEDNESNPSVEINETSHYL